MPGIGVSTFRRILSPLNPLYRAAVAWRGWRIESGAEPVRRLEWPVVSVGNLSTGGAGKTPLTIALARGLAARGFQVDVLSRGYGRRTSGALRVDPEGTAAEFGDEPLEIALTAGVPVYVARERYEAGRLAEAAGTAGGGPGVHLLDDGFQHRQLHRDVDILLLSGGDLKDRLLPGGNLREPLSAIRRATVVGIPAGEAGLGGALEAALLKRGWSGPVWRLRRRMEAPAIAGPVVAFCGIAHPAQFFAGLQGLGMEVIDQIVFPDHYHYGRRDLERLERRARAAGAVALITTEKDRVRLGRQAEMGIPLEAARLRTEIEGEAAALDWLGRRLVSGD